MVHSARGLQSTRPGGCEAFLLSSFCPSLLKSSFVGVFSDSRKTDTLVDRLSHKFIHVSHAVWSLPTAWHCSDL